MTELQEAIALAAEKEEKREVFRLQEKLVLTLEARALAVRKVATNSGGKTPGIDGII